MCKGMGNVTSDPFLAAPQSASKNGYQRLVSLLAEAYSENDTKLLTETHSSEQYDLITKLANKLSLSCRPVDDHNRTVVNREIRSLKRKQLALFTLLREVEQEAERVDARLQERVRSLQSCHRASEAQARFGVWCSGHTDDDDVEMIESVPTMAVELRPALQTQLKEHQSLLMERDAELRKLRQQLETAERENKNAPKAPDEWTSNLIEYKAEAKLRNLRRYDAVLCSSDAVFLRCAFFGWQTRVQQRTRTDRVLKECCLKLSEDTNSGNMSLLVSAWKDCTMKSKSNRARRSDAMLKKYAARMIEADSTNLIKSCFLEWWRCIQDMRAQARLEDLEATKAEERREDREIKNWVPVQQTDSKPCCAVM